MKRYREYMDSVRVSPRFHETLIHLAAPVRKPAWRRYGALAAALVLALGLGGFGLARSLSSPAESGAGTGEPEIGTETAADASGSAADSAADIAMESPAGAGDGTETIGGYEVQEGDGAESTVSYFVLPYIAYGETDVGVAGDYSLVPPDGGFRDAAVDDFLAILGCSEEALDLHLGWGGCTLSGRLGFNADGSAACAYLFGASDECEFEVELCPDRLPPLCCVELGLEVTTTDVFGVEVAGMKNVGIRVDTDRDVTFDKSLRTEFLAHGVGVRCTFYGGDEEALALLMSRFVRWAVVEGLDLSGVSPEGVAFPEDSGGTDAAADTGDAADRKEWDPSYGVDEPSGADNAATIS